MCSSKNLKGLHSINIVYFDFSHGGDNNKNKFSLMCLVKENGPSTYNKMMFLEVPIEVLLWSQYIHTSCHFWLSLDPVIDVKTDQLWGQYLTVGRLVGVGPELGTKTDHCLFLENHYNTSCSQTYSPEE